MRLSPLASGLSKSLAFVQLWSSHVTLALMVGSLTLQIAARYFGWQVDWTEELARFSFLVMVFTTASYASLHTSHLRMSFFADFVSRWRLGKRVVEALQLSSILAFDCLFFWFAMSNVIEGLRWPNLSPSLGFNEGLLFVAPVAGFAAAIVQRLISLLMPAAMVRDSVFDTVDP